MSISVSRRTFASGVRSSWLRLSMNSLRMSRKRCSSVTSSSVTQTPPPSVGRARTRMLERSSRSSSRTPASPSAAASTRVLEAVIDEGAHDGLAHQRRGLPLEDAVRRQVRGPDAQGGVEADEAETRLIRDKGEVGLSCGRGLLERHDRRIGTRVIGLEAPLSSHGTLGLRAI